MNEKEKAMRRVQEHEFALVELGLFLDSHPDCREALADIQRLRDETARERADYEQSFGPLTAGSGGNVDYWDWVATPFPWELV